MNYLIFALILSVGVISVIPSSFASDSNQICIDKIWIENSKGKIACVTPSTADKLVERGWGTILADDTIDEKSKACTKDYRPVCGVDEKTYGNMCMLESSGIELFSTGECDGDKNIVFDIVILNGRVIDPETNFDGIRNVGIKDSRIVSITEQEMSGKEVIEATGLVVSPGFIDGHFHGIDPFATKLAVLDGVTSGMDLEAGVLNIEKFYNERENNRKINYGATVSHAFARLQVLDGKIMQDASDKDPQSVENSQEITTRWSTVIPNDEEHKQIFDLLDNGLKEGAIGIGSLLGYMSHGVTSKEMFQVQKLAGEYGRLTSVHTRFLNDPPPTEFILGGQEILANAFVLNSPILFAHFNNNDWELSAQMLEAARNRGLNAWGEIYPYEAGSTFVSAEFLSLERLHVMGKTSADILDPQTGKFLDDETLLDLRKNDPGHVIVFFARPAEWVSQWVALKDVAMGSDAMIGEDENGDILDESSSFEKFAGHPRTAGAHAKSLKIARENNIPLMDVINNLSYVSAKHLGDTGLKAMQERGRLQEGMVADITIFNPKTVTDHATYKLGEAGLPSTGIPYVIVNGVIVVNNSQIQMDKYPGQPIRFELQ